MMNRNGFTVMHQLVGLVFPLLHVMFIAIAFGVVGFLCAIFITILSSMALLKGIGLPISLSFEQLFLLIAVCAIFRGVLRYIEQASNHYIAFKLLALIRHKVFVKLRSLAPAKLEGRNSGDLISLITSDIELLEVFYAHTISPIMIAIIVSIIMTVFIAQYHILLGLIALLAYLTVGLFLPLYFGKKGRNVGQDYRERYAKMNGFILDSLQGIKDSIQYNHAPSRMDEMNIRMSNIEDAQTKLKHLEAKSYATSDMSVLFFSSLVMMTGVYLYQIQQINLIGLVISGVAMISSFGPVVALSNLSNNLHHTLASGNRLLDLLEEEPKVLDIKGQKEAQYGDIVLDNVSFSYQDEMVVEDINLVIPQHKIIGIHGKSGSGKSTLLKLMMRFFETTKGNITLNNRSINEVNTSDLRDMEAYVIQETYLFNDTIANNIALGKPEASLEEIKVAAKKASIDEFIDSLPDGYMSQVGELGSLLSEGQKQRIGIARAFLHDSKIIFLDEPTSNLDSLNEAVILKSLKDESEGKTIVIVSHRDSTMSIVDDVFEMNAGNLHR